MPASLRFSADAARLIQLHERWPERPPTRNPPPAMAMTDHQPQFLIAGTLTTDGTHMANPTLLSQYSAAQFTSASDGYGGTLIGAPPTVAATDQNPIALTAPTHHA